MKTDPQEYIDALVLAEGIYRRDKSAAKARMNLPRLTSMAPSVSSLVSSIANRDGKDTAYWVRDLLTEFPDEMMTALLVGWVKLYEEA